MRGAHFLWYPGIKSSATNCFPKSPNLFNLSVSLVLYWILYRTKDLVSIMNTKEDLVIRKCMIPTGEVLIIHSTNLAFVGGGKSLLNKSYTNVKEDTLIRWDQNWTLGAAFKELCEEKPTLHFVVNTLKHGVGRIMLWEWSKTQDNPERKPCWTWECGEQS